MTRSAQGQSFAARPIIGGEAMAVKARSSQSFARHTHDEFGIGVLLSGAQRSWSGRGTVEAGPGDLITVNPGEVHDGAPIGESRTWAMIYLAPERLGAMVRDIREGASAAMEFERPVIRHGQTARLFADCLAALGAPGDEAAHERLILLIAHLLRDGPAQQAATGPLDKARARIDDDPTGHHPLADLAREADLSRYQLLRSFARLTGLTPHAYLVQRRLDLARAMLRCGGELADTAVAAGFADQSHFHRCFTRRYGLTPGAYTAALR